MKQLITNNPKTTLFCLGCLSALAMAPVYAWPLMILGYTALLWLSAKAVTWKQVGAYAFLFFFGYFLTSLYWISSSLFVEIDKWWWALPFSFAGLPFVLALFPAITLSIAGLIARFKTASLVVALIVADIARGYLFTGFPWNLPTHTWIHTDVMMTTLPHIGFWGLNSLTIIAFCMPVFLKRHLFYGYIALLTLITFIPINKDKIDTNIPDNIIMVQANIPQHEKWDAKYIWRNFDRHVDMSQSAIQSNDPQIIIWPETAVSQSFINAIDPRTEFLNFLSSLPKESILITGYLNFKDGKAYNSIAIFNRNGDIISQYDKHHLVPFGEYMPFGLDTVTGFSNFSAGTSPKTMNVDGFNIHPLICYESIFSKYTKKNQDNAILINITNDSWFGNTAGPYQHFDHMVFRAIERNTTAIRLSGNGISGIINENGFIQHLSKLNQQTVITSIHK